MTIGEKLEGLREELGWSKRRYSEFLKISMHKYNSIVNDNYEFLRGTRKFGLLGDKTITTLERLTGKGKEYWCDEYEN